MTKWVLRCHECESVWTLEVSFDLTEMKRLYHYCKVCKRNTFHEIMEKIDE